MKHSEQFTQIAAALAAASADFAEIKKNKNVTVATKKGGQYTFAYATLDAIVAAVRPALAKNGLVMVQSVVSIEIQRLGTQGNYTTLEDFLETRLLHSSGEWFSNETPVMVDSEEQSAQAFGSAITYARRYGITQLLCVVADEDDDGNAASGNVVRSGTSGATQTGGNGRGGALITEKQAGMLRAKLKAIGASQAGLCVYLQVESIEAIQKSQMDTAIKAIDDQLQVLFGEEANDDEATKLQQQAERKKAAHDEAAARNSESLACIRYHLGLEISDEVELMAAECGWGDRDPMKAANEWRQLGQQDQTALWLAPTKGGWLTVPEREEIRALLTTTNTAE